MANEPLLNEVNQGVNFEHLMELMHILNFAHGPATGASSAAKEAIKQEQAGVQTQFQRHIASNKQPTRSNPKHSASRPSKGRTGFGKRY